MHKLALQGTALVVAHAIVVGLHSWAHIQLDIWLNLPGNLFVWIVILLSPPLAAVLLWTAYRRAGALLLAASMVGGLAFGVWNHFMAMSSDHVSQVPAGTAGTIFTVTAVLLAIVEAAGAGWALWAYGKLRAA